MKGIFSINILLLFFLIGCGASFTSIISEGAAPALDPDPSISTYQQTVYPLARRHCATCHALNRQPHFASNDPKVAHNDLIEAGKVDFHKPENSRLFLRLLADKHNCWIDCETSAATMLQAIKEWIALRPPPVPYMPKIITAAKVIPATIQNKTNNQYPELNIDFDVASLLNVPGAVLRMKITMIDPYSYRIYEPQLRAPTAIDVYAKNIDIVVNGLTNPNYTTFKMVAANIKTTPNTFVMISAASLVARTGAEEGRGPGVDTLAIGFEEFRQGTGPGVDDGNLTPAQKRFYDFKDMLTAEGCLQCHAGNVAPNLSLLGLENDFINSTYTGTGAGYVGIPLVTPRDPTNSLIYRVIYGSNGTDGKMPPNGNATTRQRMYPIIRTWIDGIGQP